jgi:hypothetical protein
MVRKLKSSGMNNFKIMMKLAQTTLSFQMSDGLKIIYEYAP